MQKRRYDSDDWLGDQEDLFSLDYNKIFTRWSNPSSIKDDGSDSNIGFEILSYNSSTHTYTLNVAVNSTGIQAFAPSKPQNLQVVSNGTYPVLTWDANTEPDLSTYQVLRKMNSGSWTLIATVSTNSYTDTQVITPVQYDHFYYKICAKDTQNLYSVFSNEVSIDGYKIYKISTTPENEIQSIVPEEFLLSQNYPNPFNPTTRISFTLSEAGFVTLKVYDILGREVTTLFSKVMSAGKYEVDFDASQLPSGTYIYSINAGKQQISKKMLLIK